MANEKVTLDIFFQGHDKMGAAMRGIDSRLSKTLGMARQVGMGMTVAGGAIVGSLAAITTKAAAAGDQLAKASAKTGIAVESLSRLKYAADRSGVGFASLENALKRQARAATEAADGSAEYADAYNRLGVNVRDTSGQIKDGETLFRETAGALANVSSTTERAALAQQIFGRSGADLLPLLNQGASGLEELGKKAEELGLVFDAKAAKASEEFNDRLADLKDSLGGSARQIAIVVMPVVTQLAESLAKVVSHVTAFAKEHPTMTKGFVLIGGAIGTLMVVLGPLLVALPTLITGFQTLQGLLGAQGLASAASAATSALAGAGGLTGAVSGLGATLGSLAVAAGPILAVVAALAIMIWSLSRTYRKFKEAAAAGREAKQAWNDFATAEAQAAGARGAGDIAARQARERDAAKATIGERFWGAVTGGGVTAKDLARQRVAAGQSSAIYEQMKRTGKVRAEGGPVASGQAYLVGERGPELFMPGDDGQILPAAFVKAAAEAEARRKKREDARLPAIRHERLGSDILSGISGLFSSLAPKAARRQTRRQVRLPQRFPQSQMTMFAPTLSSGSFTSASDDPFGLRERNLAKQRADLRRAGANNAMEGDTHIYLHLADGLVAKQVASGQGRRAVVHIVDERMVQLAGTPVSQYAPI